MKKLLLLNGSHSEIPLIREAKRLGYYVITSGNNPDLIGHQYADEYIYGDYSDQDKMLQIAMENNVHAICSCANDFGAISAAFVAEQMHLSGHDSYKTAKLLHQKDGFKKIAEKINLQTPRADIFMDYESALNKKDDYVYPVIVKPVDLTGGKGVSKIDNAKEYIQAVKYAFQRSVKRRIVVEKYIQGTYHSFSTFLVNGKVHAYFSDNEYSFINPYFVATSGGPASNVEKVKGVLIRQAEMIASELQLVNGVFHMQYVMDKDQVPYIIDITRRCSGDIYTEPVEHATGNPWAKWIVMAEAGYSAEFFERAGKQTKFCGRHCIMAKKNGMVKDVFIDKELKKNIYDSIQWWHEGDNISNYLVDKVGILFCEYESEQEMLDKINRIGQLVQVVVQ